MQCRSVVRAVHAKTTVPGQDPTSGANAVADRGSTGKAIWASGRIGWVAYLVLVALFVPGCRDDASAATGRSDRHHERLIVTGSSTVAPLVGEIAKRFEKLHPEVRVDVQTGGSSRGIADVRLGLAHIGMVSRALHEHETDLVGQTLARDGICLIVHQSNPIQRLTAQQVRDIYTGQINRWQQVGGHDAPVTVVHKAQGRSTQELFLEHFQLEDRAVAPSVVIGDNAQGIKTVAIDPNAIGYVSIGAAQYEAALGTTIRLLPLDGVEASIQTVRDGTFPLSRTLTLITDDQPEGVARQFIELACSAMVHDLIQGQCYVPASP